MEKTMECERCWKIIKKIWNRKYCTKCRIKVDHELNKIYYEKHRVIDENRKRKPYVYREKS